MSEAMHAPHHRHLARVPTRAHVLRQLRGQGRMTTRYGACGHRPRELNHGADD